MKPEQFRNISVTHKTTDKKTTPKRKRFFGPEILHLYLTGTYMGDPDAFLCQGLVPYRESHEGDVSEPLGLLAKHSLLRHSGLYKKV